MRKWMMIVVLAALAGCGTVDGMGRDVSAGAQRVGGWFN
ncbi:entericidin EcnA/B family protein [Cypionkella sp.]|jgi:predicted small secreted protein|nr:entericidin EcnA/B family protein [Cypionkella sp.]MDO8985500.1 entericidin EcnA/B family protein [Cypionkella sp.]MDP2048835.1 entericidin EcnA/B family protein [Cypionkella sp.]